MDKDESVRFATKYLEDLLSFFGINVAVDSTVDDEVIQLSVPSYISPEQFTKESFPLLSCRMYIRISETVNISGQIDFSLFQAQTIHMHI